MAVTLPTDVRRRNKVVLALKRAIMECCDKDAWLELGYATGTQAWIVDHPRLLRSLDWGDSDYGPNVIAAVEHILAQHLDNVQVLLEYRNGVLADWIRDQEPDVYTDLYKGVGPLRTTIPAVPADDHMCFVIMSFSGDPALQDFYDNAIKPIVETLGYRCERVDEQDFNGGIRDQIVHDIKAARFIVADVTQARPNCYYELGMAHALGKDVIHITHSIDDVHFDIRDFNFIVYRRQRELADKLHKRIIATVGAAGVGTAGGTDPV